jgi:hypothetical protein
MMGERQVRQEALFYGFSLGEHVSADHLLRAIDRFVELITHAGNTSPSTVRLAGRRSTPS